MSTNKENILWNKKQIFDSITPFTLLDFQGVPSAILWLGGCNMRCPFCYNPEIVFGDGKYSFDEVQSFLKRRKNLLKGVVLCGGEPTIHKELYNVAKTIKEMGFKIKLDTNGLNPQMVKKLLEAKLIDFAALDFKSDEKNFAKITKVQNHHFKKFETTLELLLDSDIAYELRTTLHHDLHTIDTIFTMLEFLKTKGYKKIYYLQNFINTKQTIGNIKSDNQLDIKKIIESSNYSFAIMQRNF